MRRKCGHVALFHSGAEFVFGNYGTLLGAVECAGSIREMGSSGKAHPHGMGFRARRCAPNTHNDELGGSYRGAARSWDSLVSS
jgi:hypothetical protein